MNKKVKIIAITLLALCCALLLSACTPPPPEMTIIVVNAPEDLVIQIVYHEDLGGFFRARVSRRWWETRYRFPLSTYHTQTWPHDEITISASSEEFESFEVTIPTSVASRNSIRLNLNTQTISNPYSHGRNVIIVLLWIVILFAFDSVIFLAFWHKEKQSWKMFTIINIPLQWLFVGAWLAFHIASTIGTLEAVGVMALSILAIPLARIAKFIAEMIIYEKTITEHSAVSGFTGRTNACVIAMNMLGLIPVIRLAMTLPLPRL